jgi:uncharacterized membrane protein YgdD (TMEM256/DUF423 family)
MKIWLFLAGLNGAVAVLMGAFAAHARGPQHPFASAFSTGAHYHLVHAAAMAVAALAARGAAAPRAQMAAMLFLAGIVLFSGSLYLLTLTGVRAFGYITPVGGLALVAGWLALALAALKLETP